MTTTRMYKTRVQARNIKSGDVVNGHTVDYVWVANDGTAEIHWLSGSVEHTRALFVYVTERYHKG